LVKLLERTQKTMNVKEILAQLRKERETLDSVIANLEALECERPGPGRPRKIRTNGTSHVNGSSVGDAPPGN
jgi:hypothetical protein